MNPKLLKKSILWVNEAWGWTVFSGLSSAGTADGKRTGMYSQRVLKRLSSSVLSYMADYRGITLNG